MRISAIAVALVASLALAPALHAADMPGVTATEIKIGQTIPYSGPVAAFGTSIGQSSVAYFAMINAQGGINGRKITLLSVDDGYNPAKTVEQTRKLVEQDGVAFIFAPLGTGPSLSTRKYLNDHKVPQLLVQSGASEFVRDSAHFPWSIASVPSYRLDGRMVGAYVLKHKPQGKIGVLYQNDAAGKASLEGLHAELGDKAASLIVKEVSYEISDPTVDSQIIALQESGADVFYSATTPKPAAQAIRKIAELGWKPLQFLLYPAASVSGTLTAAGLDKSVGIISHIYLKDPQDPTWQDDPAIKDYAAWMQKYYPHPDMKNLDIAQGYYYGMLLTAILKQCGDDLSRAHIMQVATNLHALSLPILLPGVTINTSPTDYEMFKSVRNMQFDGKRWQLLPID